MKTAVDKPKVKLSKPFVFKQFTIDQDRCALKVNTDAVLLGALAEAKDPRYILDIGAGTGVISLMMAQRYQEALIHSVEIENNAFLQASQNFLNSPWSVRMQAFHVPFQQFGNVRNTKYDLIVSNPPYYMDHLKTQNHERNLALHSESLSFGELCDGVKETLTYNGVFYAILPERQMEDMIGCFQTRGLYPNSKFNIIDKPGAKTLRVICSFGFLYRKDTINETMIIKDPSGKYSSAYASLLKDFLLIF